MSSSMTLPASGTILAAGPLWYYSWTPGDLHTVGSITVSADWTIEACKQAMLQKARSSTSPFDTCLYKIPDDTPLLAGNYSSGLARLSIADLGEPLSPMAKLHNIFGGIPSSDQISMVFVDSVNIEWSFLGPGHARPDAFLFRALGKQSVFDFFETMTQSKPALAGHPEVALYRAGMEDQELDRRAPLTTIFASSPFDEPLAIIIKTISREFKVLRDWNPSDRLAKDPKLHAFSPSEWSASRYTGLQGFPNERIIDYRFPHLSGSGAYPDKDLPPIEVVFKGFGDFLESWRAEYETSFQKVAVTQDLKEDVDSFANAMSEVYVDELQRQLYGLNALNKLFRRVLGPGNEITNKTITTFSRSLVKPDGYYTFGHLQIPCCLIEFKHEGQSSPVPLVELVANYSRLVANVGSRARDVHAASRFPALAITIIAPVVTMYAFAYVGSVICVPLTSGFSCLPIQYTIDRQPLYVAFAAASCLLTSIKEHAQLLVNVPPPPPVISAILPDINELRSIDDSAGYISFTITGVLKKDIGRHLYRAEGVVNGIRKRLVIKLTYAYGVEVHKRCAELGYAPTLYAYERLSGGVLGIAMEYVEGHTLDSVPAAMHQQHNQKWADTLHNFVTAIHDENYVHGDLRSPNILCVRDKVLVLDFDWAGQTKQAFYPCRNLNQELTFNRDMRNLEITKEDDLRVLKETIRVCLPEAHVTL